MTQFYDPWAKVGQSANNALFKYLSSQPDPSKQAMYDAQINAQNAAANKSNLESQRIQSQLMSPDNMAKIFGDIYAPVEAPAPSPDFVGPMAPTAPSQNTVGQRYQENLPELVSNAMRFAGAKPSSLGDVFMAIAGAGGASPDMLTRAQMGAGLDYAKTQPGFEADVGNSQFTLSPGAMRFDAQGNEIASAPFKPDTGGFQIRLPDGTLVSENGTMQAEQPQPQPLNLYDTAGDVGGLKGTLAELYSNIAGQVLPVPDSVTDIVEGRQDLTTAQNDLVRSLSLNPRFPVAEVKRILDENPVAPRWDVSGESAQAKQRSLANSLLLMRDEAMKDVYNTGLDEDTRQAQMQSANAIDVFLRKLNVPATSSDLIPQPAGTPDSQGRRSLDDIFGN